MENYGKRVERELLEDEQNEAAKVAEKDQPEQSMQIHTHFEPIQSMTTESQENSSNEESSADGIKLLKSMTSVLSSLQKNVVSMGSNMIKALNTQKEERKDFAEVIKVLTELDNTLKKNTYETHVSNLNFSNFEKKLYSRQSEMMDLERHINDDRHRETLDELSFLKNQMMEIQGCLRRNDGERLEFADSIARKFQAKENAKADAEKDQPRITQGESSRRSDGVSTDTRSRRAPSNDENPRPTKRGGDRSGGDRGGRSSGGGRGRQSGFDQRGRASGGDCGGRSSGSGRGGRSLPPFLNMLTGQDMNPTNPRVKMEEQ
ncbi:keratin, type I cytoskeletal 9-like [Impatiens glandulifera]|uniref:keratin, type I cytoskeletal 9-like n=1 Tax=Impatiens glandulifera TaxID=253017 RepID=UPI001FB05D32|nr:keratin, type I cytoskeletal 9-like [Impatiens glandulifera]